MAKYAFKNVFSSNSIEKTRKNVANLFIFCRITEADWENPHPCDSEPEELENKWNIHNCIWLAVGSIMQQGCDILPK